MRTLALLTLVGVAVSACEDPKLKAELTRINTSPVVTVLCKVRAQPKRVPKICTLILCGPERSLRIAEVRNGLSEHPELAHLLGHKIGGFPTICEKCTRFDRDIEPKLECRKVLEASVEPAPIPPSLRPVLCELKFQPKRVPELCKLILCGASRPFQIEELPKDLLADASPELTKELTALRGVTVGGISENVCERCGRLDFTEPELRCPPRARDAGVDSAADAAP